MRYWTDAASHLNPMFVVLDVEVDRDAEWDDRDMRVERLVNVHMQHG